MKEILLTQGKVALVDDEDFERLNQFKWCAHSNKAGNLYATRNLPGHPRKTIKMHHLIMKPFEGMEIDHINGNSLDNRRENLRIVTRRQNQQNLHIQKYSKYPGVTRHKQSKKWISQIKISGKKRYLGSFDNEIDAATAYRVACAVLAPGGCCQ